MGAEAIAVRETKRILISFLLLILQICGEVMNVVVGILLHQIDMGLKPVHSESPSANRRRAARFCFRQSAT